MDLCPSPVTAWHRVVTSGDPAGLADLLADDVVFRSPAMHSPQVGRAAATSYLRAAMTVLGPTLTYREQWYADSSAVLEFEATLHGGLEVHGVDMLRWNEDGRLTEFVVMVRPFTALNQLIGLMAGELKAQQRAG